MPHLPVIAKTYRVAFEWEAGAESQHAVNVMHFQTDEAGITPAQLSTVIQNNVTQAMWGPVAGSASVKRLAITPLDGVTSTQAFPTDGTTKWDGENGTQFTPQVAAVIKLQTALRGRSNRGRIFLPFTGEANVAFGLFDSTLVDDTTAAWVAFANDIQGAGHPTSLGVASYKGAGAWHQAVNLAMETQSGTQRRRQSRNR